MNVSDAYLEMNGRGFGYLSQPRMLTMLNAGKNAFEDQWEFPWLQASITGVAPLVVPDLKYVQTVKTGASELLGMDVRQLAEGDTNLAQTGTPEFWYVAAQVGDAVTLAVWPVAAVALTVIYTRYSPELATPSDVPLIPVRHHPLWIDYACIEAYHDADNYAAAQQLRGEAGVRMMALIETYETRNRQHAVFNSQRTASEDD